MGASPATNPAGPDNAWLAAKLEEVAELLEAQEANPFRVRAYRRAAAALCRHSEAVSALLAARGSAGLREIEGVGESLARALEELVRTGRLALLERLRSGSGPEDVLTTVAGIGPELAHRIHELLGIDSLYALEAAAHDGRLASVAGMGPVRVRAVREALAGRFQRHVPLVPPAGVAALDEPPVAELLDIDREYRERGAAGALPRIAPRRFNPAHEAWLPVLHTERAGRHYTALYSNTARAHELGAMHDWVVIYRDDHEGHGQWTVVSARRGALAGRRVVRGREARCAALYGLEPNGGAP
ncbi:MAG: DNA-binding protein [Planctomycetes bacterium]|nr:DNA-binding protein [Planctomycetota bacterium]